MEKPSVLEADAFVAAMTRIDLVMILEDSGLSQMEALAEADKRIGIAMEHLPEMQMRMREQYSHDERRRPERPTAKRYEDVAARRAHADRGEWAG